MDTTSIPDANVVPPPQMNTETLPTISISPAWNKSFIERNKKLLLILGSLAAVFLVLVIIGMWRWYVARHAVPPGQMLLKPQQLQQSTQATLTPSVAVVAQQSPSLLGQVAAVRVGQQQAGVQRTQQQSRQALSAKKFGVPTKPPQAVVAPPKQQQQQQQQQLAKYRPPVSYVLHKGPYKEKIQSVINPDDFLRLPPSSFRVKKQPRRQDVVIGLSTP